MVISAYLAVFCLALQVSHTPPQGAHLRGRRYMGEGEAQGEVLCG